MRKILIFCSMFSSILSFPVFSEIERWKQMLSNNCAAPGGGFEGDFQPQLRKLRRPQPSGQGVISGHHHIAQKVFSMVERRIFRWFFLIDAYDVMVKVVYDITFSIHSRCQRFHLFHIMWVGILQWVILPQQHPQYLTSLSSYCCFQMKSRCGSPRLGTKAGAFQERYLFQIHRLAHNASPGIGVVSNSKKQRIKKFFLNLKYIFEQNVSDSKTFNSWLDGELRRQIWLYCQKVSWCQNNCLARQA